MLTFTKASPTLPDRSHLESHYNWMQGTNRVQKWYQIALFYIFKLCTRPRLKSMSSLRISLLEARISMYNTCVRQTFTSHSVDVWIYASHLALDLSSYLPGLLQKCNLQQGRQTHTILGGSSTKVRWKLEIGYQQPQNYSHCIEP